MELGQAFQERRLGRLYVNQTAIAYNENGLLDDWRTFLRDALVIRAQEEWDRPYAIGYVVVHPDMEPLDEGLLVPEYEVIFTRDKRATGETTYEIRKR